jgi:hypothetical protein
MIETVKQPYELLVRWREGKISGAHVGFELTTTEDGKVLSTSPLAVIPVDIGQGIGFPLADILAQVQVDALVSRDKAIAERGAAETALTAAQEVVAKHEATIATLTTELTELKALSNGISS